MSSFEVNHELSFRFNHHPISFLCSNVFSFRRSTDQKEETIHFGRKLWETCIHLRVALKRLFVAMNMLPPSSCSSNNRRVLQCHTADADLTGIDRHFYCQIPLAASCSDFCDRREHRNPLDNIISVAGGRQFLAVKMAANSEAVSA
jgi:hypothetical protein